MVQANQIDVTDAMRGEMQDGGADIVFCERVDKMTRHNETEQRELILSGEHLYLFGGDKLMRRHRITKLATFIFSSVSSEVVFQFPGAKDLRIADLSQDQILEFINAMKKIFGKKLNAKIYRVPEDSLKEYCSEDKNQCSHIENLPLDEYRRADLEDEGSAISIDANATEVSTKTDDTAPFQHCDGNLNNIVNRFHHTAAAKSGTKEVTDEDRKGFQDKSGLVASGLGDEVTLDSFDLKGILGQGAFGKVYLAELP